MTDERLIEEAAKAMFAADPPSNPHGPDSDLVFDEPYTRAYSANLRILARAALAGFEKAHTPTDTIPQYAMLDLHMALYGVEADFDAFYRGHGYAEAWARLLAAVRELHATPTVDEREALYLIEQAASFREQTSADVDAFPNSMVGLWLRTASALESALRRSEVPASQGEAEVLADVRAHAARWADRPPTSPYAMGLRDAWRTILRKIDGVPLGVEPQGEEPEWGIAHVKMPQSVWPLSEDGARATATAEPGEWIIYIRPKTVVHEWVAVVQGADDER